MSTEILSLWPSRVVGPAGEWGDQTDRVRSFVYTNDEGTVRLIVLDAQGRIVARTDVSSYQFNGGGMDCTDPDGRVWHVVAIAGCASCGGGASASMAYQILQRSEDIVP